MTDQRHRTIYAITAALAAVALYWAIALFPTPGGLLDDHAQGYQLAAASEILAGHHPFVDFKDTYGPLVFYASAFTQWISGGRVGGELALVSLSLALGYTLLFRLLLGLGIGLPIAVGATLVAIFAQPAGYRYYLTLLPLVFFVVGWRYVEAPRRSRLVVLALGITVAGLFRPDLGVYTYGAGLVLVATSGTGRTWREAGAFTGFILLWAMPWLLWIGWRGGLIEYLAASSVEAMKEASGRARPAPWLDFSDGAFSERNLKAFVFRLPLLTLVFAGIMIVIRRVELRGVERARILCVASYALLSLPQVSHMVDWSHTRDALAVRMLLLAWIAAGLWRGASLPASWGGRVAVGAAVATLVAGQVLGTVGYLAKWNRVTPAPMAIVEKLRRYGCGRDEFLAEVRRRGESFRAELCEYVRDHSAPDETIFAVIETPQINYFANRRLAGRQMAVFPGYFLAPSQERELIKQIRVGRTAFIVADDLEVGPDYPGLTLDRYAPEFFAFLQNEFLEVKQFGHYRVLRPRWRPTAVEHQ